ncbi:MAG: DcaP family trimeric outer membrane transporter [Gammaproteobacteria bacterium]|jgi:hypothetical protein
MKTSNRSHRLSTILLSCLLASIGSIGPSTGLAAAEQGATAPANDPAGRTAEPPVSDASIAELRALLERQQRMIESQRQQIQTQQSQIDQQQQQLSSQTGLLEGMQTRLDQLEMEQGQTPRISPEEDLRETVATLQERLAAIPEDPVSALGEESFPGSLRLPGTNAAMKIGGFVKGTLVKSFDPLATTDRFIVGSIPVGDSEPGAEEQSSLTANQSRVNLEMREKTGVGDLRAFVEADFASSGDTFRLRHAYGQYGNILTGKTWSTFFDPLAGPEEIDFEGINGRTILRQTQIRWFPRIGRDWNMQVALEDPQSKVSEIDLQGSPTPGDPGFNPDFGEQIDSNGVSDLPDLVASIRRTWFGRWHLKTAFVWHQIRAQYSQQPSLPKESEAGWGLTTSGAFKAGWLDDRDNIKFQLIFGDGISHYVNDPNSIGGQDGVFTPDGSSIKTLPILAGFAAYQHWWGDTLRSNFIVSGVEIDNEGFQPDDAYKRTIRASTNLFWSPTPRVDVAAEFIWGQRTNKDGEEGDASQIQFATKYRF